MPASKPTPTSQQRYLPTTPPPRVQATQADIPTITPAAPYSPVHDLCPVPSPKPLKPTSYTKQQPHSLPIVEPDDKRDSTPTTRPSSLPRRSTHLISNRSPCNILCQALYHIINLGFSNAPTISIPQKLTRNQYTGPVIEIKEYCNGVVHPVTKEKLSPITES